MAFSRYQFLQESSIIDAQLGSKYACGNTPHFHMMSYFREIYIGLYKMF